MARKFNLLPVDLAESKEIEKFSKTLLGLSIFFAVVSVVIGISGLAGYFFYSKELTKLGQEQENLKTSIKNLESTEQGLVLIRDRTQKIANILTSRITEGTFSKQMKIVENMPQDVYFKGSEITVQESGLDLLTQRSLVLSNFFTDLVKRQDLGNLVLKELNFNPGRGYFFTLQIY